MAEFLPLCDVLFTVISLAGYFCDVIFDLVMAWALAGRGKTLICIASLTMIAFSLIVSQVLYSNICAQNIYFQRISL